MKKAIALGTFDGLHKGHLAVLTMPDIYDKIALTFEKPPKAFIKGENRLLMTFEDKVKELGKMGISTVKMDFNRVAHISAEDFLIKIKNDFNPAFISCGFNYRFGNGGKGDVSLLADFCRENHIELQVCGQVSEGDEPISSSRIRRLLLQGEIKEANSFLKVPFSFTGEILHGDGRGKTLGFPTINQTYPKELTPIKNGVYKTVVDTPKGRYPGLTNIGRRPTYPLDYTASETFIKDFSGDLYGQNVKITLLDFLREEIKFDSQEDLKAQIEKDMKEI